MRTTIGPGSSLVLALLAVGGCRNEPGAPTAAASGPLRVDVRAGVDSLVLTNHGTRPLGTFVVGRQRAALIFWGPCADPERCPALRGGERATVAYPAPTPGGEREAEGIVYWWYMPAAAGIVLPSDSIHPLVVPLP